MAMTTRNPLSSCNDKFDLFNAGRLTVVSYNLHGLNQGAVGITELMNNLSPGIIMVQEHWLSTDINRQPF
jgi:hypothetical protein